MNMSCETPQKRAKICAATSVHATLGNLRCDMPNSAAHERKGIHLDSERQIEWRNPNA